jgi:hypothetical protein
MKRENLAKIYCKHICKHHKYYMLINFLKIKKDCLKVLHSLSIVTDQIAVE